MSRLPTHGARAATLLRSVFKKYGTLESYEDEGEVRNSTNHGKGECVQIVPFRTFYCKPNRLRLEWHDSALSKPGDNSVLWINETDSILYMGNRVGAAFRIARTEGLHAAAGISIGVSNSVPRLLSNIDSESREAMSEEFQGGRYIRKELVGDDECHLVYFGEQSTKEWAFWIREEDGAIVRLRTLIDVQSTIGFREQILRNFKMIAKINFSIMGKWFDKGMDWKSPFSSEIVEDRKRIAFDRPIPEEVFHVDLPEGIEVKPAESMIEFVNSMLKTHLLPKIKEPQP